MEEADNPYSQREKSRKMNSVVILQLFGKINEVTLKGSDKSGEMKLKKKIIFLNKGIDSSLCRFNGIES